MAFRRGGGGSRFPDFDDDPFFQPHRDSFRSFFDRDPFQSFGALEGPSDRRGDRGERDRGAVERHGMFGGMEDPFAHMNRMMEQMSRNFGRGFEMPSMDVSGAGAPGGQGQGYSYSSVMSYSNQGGGEPKYFEASSSTRHGPGGVKETRKTVRDSESGMNKMAIGHHINDRGHVIERSHNKRTNERDERQNFINMDESEGPRFNEEWSRATRDFHRRPPNEALPDRHRPPHNGRSLKN